MVIIQDDGETDHRRQPKLWSGEYYDSEFEEGQQPEPEKVSWLLTVSSQ